MFKEKILPKLILLNTRLILGTYTAFTLPFYTIFQRPWRVLSASKQQWATKEKSADGQYYYWKRLGPPVTLPNDYHLCNTLQEVYLKMKKFEDLEKDKLGYRDVLSAKMKYDSNGQPIRQDGRIVKEIKLANKYTWLKTKDVFEKFEVIGSGFKQLGLTSDDRVIMFADTRIEWFISSFSLMLFQIPIATLFSNLGKKGFVYGVNQQKARCIVTSFDLLERILDVVDQIPTVEKIVYMQYNFQKDQQLPKFPDRIQLISFDQLEEIGRKSLIKIPKNLPSSDQVSVIMYTSGTTGIPKAVLFTNKQLMSAITCLASNVIEIADQGPRHRYASFLPLAHSLGFTFEWFLFCGGVQIGYSSPYTLTDTSPGNPPGQFGDLKLLQPTTLVSVPLILDRIVKEIYLKLSARSPILPPLFTYLMQYKIRWLNRGYRTPLLDKIVCRRVQEQFGGKLEFIICGGAALNQKTEEIIRAALNVKVMTGYGLTETTGGVTGKTLNDMTSGMAGAPMEGAMIRLIDWKEGGYSFDDKPNPRGEIVIGGDSVAQGYYQLEDETNAVFKTDSNGVRWLHSGDIGEMFPNGLLKIIDRKKDLAKLPNGEYISLGRIEGAIKTAPTVENCCICLHEKINDIVALITPSAKKLKILAEKLKKSNLTYEQLCSDPQINQAIMEDIREVCLQSGLSEKEIPKKIAICPEEWSPDNDLLTSAFKLKRNSVLKYYAKDIDNLFQSTTTTKM
uniref:long-chain-fatty-acid--CoA ligase n=1 Tax=Dermatophagoides pteronyssinus TaxID=6956 RepID=A0A6P6XUD5_DERPT|nr:long-chain-fatty-acid--CoA ligase 4-like [Dermatophagoides pteronyssinus]